MESLTKGIGNINDEYYFGDNLSHEKIFKVNFFKKNIFLNFFFGHENKLRKKFLILTVFFILAREVCLCRLK